MLGRLAAPLLGGAALLCAVSSDAAAESRCVANNEARYCRSDDTGVQEMWLAVGDRVYSNQGRVYDYRGDLLKYPELRYEGREDKSTVTRFEDGFVLAATPQAVLDIHRGRGCALVDYVPSLAGTSLVCGSAEPEGEQPPVAALSALKRALTGPATITCLWYGTEASFCRAGGISEMWIAVGQFEYHGTGRVAPRKDATATERPFLTAAAKLKSGGTYLGFSDGVELVVQQRAIYALREERQCQMMNSERFFADARFVCSNGRPAPGVGEAADREKHDPRPTLSCVRPEGDPYSLARLLGLTCATR